LLDGSKEECAKLEAHAGKSLHDLKQCRVQRREFAGEVKDLKNRKKALSI
jgi:hypothetical protein